jgi:lipoprotein-anchoring transpeptidase ErfK/SrfK
MPIPGRFLPASGGPLLLVAGLVLLGGLLAPPAAAQLARPAFGAVDAMPRPTRAPSDSGRAAPARRAAPLSHVVGRQDITLYNRPDASAPVRTLPPRTPLRRLDCTDGWCRVRTDGGDTGYVRARTISSTWIRVSKADRRLYLYRGPRLVATHTIDVGYNTFADKQRRGSRTKRDHWRTPEGTFYVVAKNPQSQFYKALVLNYPTTADARRGLRQDLITRSEYNAIVRAQQNFRMPPMNTTLGGWIEIHGEGTGGATNWTQGCVAVQNRVMNRLWTQVEVGTPVLIE